MSQSSSRFIEDEQHDQQSLAVTEVMITENTVMRSSVMERAKKLQEMLILQQQRLHQQHLQLLALEEYLKQQAQKVIQSSQDIPT